MMSSLRGEKYEKKAFFYSLLLHTALFGSYFTYIYINPIALDSKSDVISLSIASFELPAQNVAEPTKPVNHVKKIIEPTKNIEKPVKKAIITKPIEKQVIKPIEKPIEKPIIKPIEEPIKKVKEVSQPIQQQVSNTQSQKMVEKVLDKKGQEQNFVQTNFGIIRDMVLSNLIYPRVAQKRRWTGVVEVALIIDIDGKLFKTYISKSSGRKLLDKAALKAVNSLKDLPLPIPEVKSTIFLPIAFSLK